MKYLDAIKISLFVIARILFAVAVVLLLAYIVYRCLPRRIKCKITRWLKTLGE